MDDGLVFSIFKKLQLNGSFSCELEIVLDYIINAEVCFVSKKHFINFRRILFPCLFRVVILVILSKILHEF